MPTKAEPQATPETQPFWDACQSETLLLPRCVETGRFFFYPAPYSPFVLGGAIEWLPVSGKATLYSYVINTRPAPGFEEDAPYVIAVVELEEGPRMMTNLVDVDPVPELLPLDLPLDVRFQQRGDKKVPVFAPAVTR
jgi:uncharacterized OB-fold protein